MYCTKAPALYTNIIGLGLCHKDSDDIVSHSASPGSDNSDRDSEVSDGSNSSDESIASSQTSYSEDYWSLNPQPDPYAPTKPTLTLPKLQVATETCHAQQFQHPRRTAAREGPVPTLNRVTEKKGQFVYHLVESAANLVEVVWPTASPTWSGHHGSQQCGQNMLPLRHFIEETLRRSKTTFSTLQVALYYLVVLKPHVPAFDFTMEQPDDSPLTRALQCGRRMFLAALILGSKYLQDRNYSARAWSKISGLQVHEINLNERAFLNAVNFNLHVSESTFNRWQEILIKFSQPAMRGHWRRAVVTLTPEMVSAPRTQEQKPSFKPVEWRSQTQSPVSPVEQQWVPTPIKSATVAAPATSNYPLYMPPPAPPSALRLPTPSPMSSICPTPAASSANDLLRLAGRPRAMCAALSMATSRMNMEMPPTAMGLNGAPGQFSRRSSLATVSSVAPSPTSTLAQSPASMISDHSSSRSSSIASTTYQQTSPVRNYALARLAAANNYHSDLPTLTSSPLSQSDDTVTILGSRPLTSGPYFTSPEPIIVEDDAPPSTAHPAFLNGESRKRHRSSVDSNCATMDYVRDLLRTGGVRPTPPHMACKRAAKKAKSGNMENMTEVIGRPELSHPTGGPGMWQGILY